MTTTETAISRPLAGTFDRMLRDRLPNLFRLHLNPFVTQACFCLDRYVRTSWHGLRGETAPFQSFLANSFDEAVGGAIKLARYCAAIAARPSEGLVLDSEDRLGCFASIDLAPNGRIDFIPGLRVVRSARDSISPDDRFGFIVLVGEPTANWGERVETLIRRNQATLIACVSRESLTNLRGGGAPNLRRFSPDIVVFDESFVNREVPFGAFCARGASYDHWKGAGRANFHSTTFQPNTISSLHFVRCLKESDAEFFSDVTEELRRIAEDFDHRAMLFGRLYSGSLAKAIRQTGCNTPDVSAEREFVIVNGQRIFDGVSGVACSVRGHNPPQYCQEIESLSWMPDPAAALAARLAELTGLPHVLPAVSGAGAVESALKLGLVAQYPRRHVLALRSGFGGKTLLSLTGTWKSFYKEHIGPLYQDVSYINPFAPDAIAQLEAEFSKNPIAVVQVEAVQGVGGVRAVPESVLRYLSSSCQEHGHLLLVDEVQTGMHRTGPFTRSGALNLEPDLLTLGKGTSDMMFPFSLMLCTDAVAAKVDRAAPSLRNEIQHRYGYEHGYRTVLNVLNQADRLKLEKRVTESGAMMERLLRESLAGCPAVRDVRVFGMLVGIELDDSRWPHRWFRKRLFWFYLLSMLYHRDFPVLVGFCQYEPNVLKITPPLTAEPKHLREACAAIAEVLNTPFPMLAVRVARNLIRPTPIKRRSL